VKKNLKIVEYLIFLNWMNVVDAIDKKFSNGSEAHVCFFVAAFEHK
jgi:hypothetical protein